MRYKDGQKQEARSRMVAGAARGFRRHGYAGIGVDGLAREADVTSGAFYKHFSSKEEAFQAAVAEGIAGLKAGVEAFQARYGADWVEPFVDFYLGERRLCALEESCAMQSLSVEVMRGSDQAKQIYQHGMEQVAALVAAGLPSDGAPPDRLAAAWAFLSILAGGVTLARAVASPAVSAQMAAAVRQAALACIRTAPATPSQHPSGGEESRST